MQFPATFRNSPWRSASKERTGSVVLIAASLLVGVAIASPDPYSRLINGISGLLWIGGAGILIMAVRDDDRFWRRLAAVALVGMLLVLIVRPSDLLMASLGFGAAGALVAGVMGPRGRAWATLLPALWLPEHLLTAVARAIYRSARDLPATIRSEPPPTAALVPFAMVIAAMGAAWVVHGWLNRARPARGDRERGVAPRL